MKTRWWVVSALLVLALLNTTAWAADYYVDDAKGNDAWDGKTLSTAWKTITKANGVLQAGDTVYIRAGTYSGQIIQPNNSGTSDTRRIIYSGYNGEDVLIRDSAYGIYIYKKSYITVNGIRFVSLRRFMRIYAGHYNTISYCDFDQRSPASGDWVGALIADDYNDNTAASENSIHNWVHHCSFYRWVYGTYAEHRGALLDIGSSDTGEEDESYYNLIEENTFAYGGHHTLGVYSKYNVIRNNYFHNETNPAHWAYEGYRATLTEGPHAGFCLYEGNRFGFAGASGMALRSQYNIFRGNIFYRTDSGSIQVVSNIGGVDHADYNHIYNNSFYHNGYLADYINFRGAIYFSSWGGQSPLGNVIKNNIFYDNRDGSIRYDGSVDPQIIVNNWDQNSVDPGFVDLSGTNPDNPDLPDLHLKANSTAIDEGTFLTTITSASGSGAQFQVADARYFMDGWGIPHVQGDEIKLHGSAQRARIGNINYSTNTITVDKILNWTQNQGIGLVYQGSAPDLGAYEYVPGIALSSPTGGETWVQGFSHAITWSSSGVTEPVKIELIKSGSTILIANNISVADGSYTWPIPNGQTPGSDYTVKISTETYEDTSEPFTIVVPAAPIVQTLAAQSITISSASLRGTVHPMGLTTTYYFEYGLTAAYGSATADVALAAGAATTSVQVAITGLNASTTYHYRIVATNSEGTTEGNDLIFTTSGGGASGNSGGGGGGGGGCFIFALRGPYLWFMVLGLALGLLVWTTRRAKSGK